MKVVTDVEGLRRELEASVQGEVRFDAVSRALYSTDASVYQILPVGVVVPRTREDIIRIVEICGRRECPITMRGGGTSQAGQAVGEGLHVDTSKYFNRLLEVNAAERWARVEPGIVLDELNAKLKPHGLRFPVDVSTASRATLGGMMANNSSGARSVIYGKTIDHVLDQEVLLSDGSLVHFGPLTESEVDRKCAGNTLEAACYSTVRHLAVECAEEVERRYPKVMRRVGGYNLDEFTRPGRPFNLAKLMIGSEGTLGIVLEARVNLVPLPAAKAVLAILFHDLLDALAAAPVILEHSPSAVEVMDKFVLDYTKGSVALEAARRMLIVGDPGALLCIEFYADRDSDLPPRLEALEQDLRQRGFGYHYTRAIQLADQARIWGLRESALGLSMAMKDDNKSVSFVEDTAVQPAKLRDYIDRFLRIVRGHGTVAGVYAHASVGCLHVRPVVNLKTDLGVKKFEAIANDIADLVLEFGGALSGEHGDGYVRSPFLKKMFGEQLYEAFRTIKQTFDPQGILNPGKIVNPPPLTSNLRFGAAYRMPKVETHFDFSEYGGMGGAVEMCSGVGACRKKLDGTMCPSFMVTLEEKHSTRGRANVLRLAMTGKLADAGLDDEGVKDALSLCLECRACKAECPVGVDVARFKSEFLSGYWERHGVSRRARLLGHVHEWSRMARPFAGLANLAARSTAGRWLNEQVTGVDRRRMPPRWTSRTLRGRVPGRDGGAPQALLFVDTFTNYYDPEIGEAALAVLSAAGVRAALAPNVCCGRTLISQGLLREARELAARNAELLQETASRGVPLIFCEPSCLSAIREDAPALLRGASRAAAEAVARSAKLFEEYAGTVAGNLKLRDGPKSILLHGHCHQKAMGLLPPAKRLLEHVPGAKIVDLDAGCCGMAGSFGYAKEHFEVSRAIGERKLLPAARAMGPEDVLVASGHSCRHQVEDFAGKHAVHPAILLLDLLQSRSS